MSDFSPDQDELASAYLDGEANADERARVEGDPRLLARVDELRGVREALSAPVTLPTEAERDAMVTAAAGVSNVVDLNVARGRRRLRIASIAAAVLLVLGAAGALIRAASTQSETKFETVAGSIGSTAAGEATAARAAGPAAGTNPFATASGRAVLGSFADRSSLVAATQSQVHNPALDQRKQESGTPAAPTANDNATTTAPSCLVPAPRDSTNELYAATAALEGRVVQIDVFTLADGSLTLVVTDAATCAAVFSQSV